MNEFYRVLKKELKCVDLLAEPKIMSIIDARKNTEPGKGFETTKEPLVWNETACGFAVPLPNWPANWVCIVRGVSPTAYTSPLPQLITDHQGILSY